MNHQHFGELAKKFLYFQKKASKESLFILTALYGLELILINLLPDFFSLSQLIYLPPLIVASLLIVSGLLSIIND
jgi:hypothetical protein